MTNDNIATGPIEWTEPNWTPLEGHIGAGCGEWMWMHRQNGLEYYKHRGTRRYIALDAAGNAYGLKGRMDFRTAYAAATETN